MGGILRGSLCHDISVGAAIPGKELEGTYRDLVYWVFRFRATSLLFTDHSNKVSPGGTHSE